MLPRNWRLVAYNNTGVSCTVAINGRAVKRATDGSLEYESAEASLLASGAIASGAYGAGTGQDNSTTEWEETDCQLEVTPGSAPSGQVTVFFQRSTDGGTTWPDNGKGFPVLTVTPSGTSLQIWDFSV